MTYSDNLASRDNWKLRADLYRNGSRPGTQNGEDLAARRILRGLGYTEKGIDRLEAELELPYDATKPLYDRVVTCLEIVSNGMFSSDRAHRRMALVYRDTDESHGVIVKHLDEWFQMAEPEREGLIVIGRCGRNRVAYGYVIMRDDACPPSWIMQHPAVLLQSRDGWWVWYREVSDLVHDMAKFERWSVPGSVDFDPDPM